MSDNNDEFDHGDEVEITAPKQAIQLVIEHANTDFTRIQNSEVDGETIRELDEAINLVSQSLRDGMQTMSDNNDESNVDISTTHRVSETADKIRAKQKVKRGTGTRDQDELELVVKGDDGEEVIQELNKAIVEYKETADEVRNLQPEVEEDDDA